MNTTHDDAQFLALLERWRKGDFTRQDEQALQTLTDGDAFRQEAWAGYRADPATAHEATILRLRKRLKVRPSTGSGLQWGRLAAVAASVAVLAVAIWRLALPAPQPRQVATALPPQMQDSLVLIGNATQPAPPLMAPAPVVITPVAQTAPEPTVLKKGSAPATPADQPLVAAAEAEIADIVAAQPAREAAKAVSPSSGAPLPPVVARSRKPIDSNVALPDAVPGAPLGQAKSENEITLLKAEPTNGWKAFESYLRESAYLPFEAANNNISGFVRLSFVVQPDGTPAQFIIKKPLGYGCDEEAVRLVSAWEWLPGKDSSVTIEVWFRK